MLRLKIALAAVILTGSACHAQPAGSRTAATPARPRPTPTIAVGMNLTGLAYFSTEDPFLDKAKLNDWSSIPAANKDATGFPNSLPPATTQLMAATPLSVGGGNYVLLYEGSPAANLWAGGNRTGRNVVSLAGVSNVQLRPGRITFRADGGAMMWIINGFDAANPIRDVHIVRADQEAAWRKGAIFTPAYLDVIGKRFSPHRYMDWGCTNGSKVARWADRPKPTDASWSCAPLEVMIAEANASHADMWLTLPHLADDDYVRQAATLVRDTLAPGLKVHLEYSNEVWNNSFEQAKWADARGKARFGDHGWNAERWYGYRAAQVMALAGPILGERMIGVYATFTGFTDPAIDAAIDDGIARAKVGTLRSLFGEYAVTTYFGDQLGNPQDQRKILGWAAAGPAGLTSAFAELEHGGALSSDFSLDNVARRLWPFHAAEARKRGLPMIAYEGGLSGYWFAWERERHAPAIAFVARLKADPRMGDLYAKMAARFAAAGGTMMAPFNDVGGVTIWGPWGGQPDLATTSPQMEALKTVGGR